MRIAGVLQAHQYFLTRHLLLVICTLREVCRRSDAAKSLLLVEPFCRNFLSFHRLKVAFRAKVLFVRTVALSLLCEGTRDAIDSSRYKKIP